MWLQFLPFLPLQTDTFSIEAVDLGPIESLTVGYEPEGDGTGWYLDKATLKEGEEGEPVTFPCDK